MTTESKENVYVQPDCKVYQVHVQQMIATSPGTTSGNEEYTTGNTNDWF